MRFESLEQRALLATLVWNGGVDANWSTAGNWKGGVAPQAGDNLVFPGVTGAALTNNNDLPVDTAFNTIEITGSGYTIGGNSILLAGGLTANNVTGTNTFKPDITLQNAQSFVNANSGSTLNIESKLNTGNLIGNYFFGTAPAVMFDGSGTINAKGIISGAGSVSKLGSGTTVLSGANTFEGIAEARQGVLRAASASALGSATTGHTEVQAGAALELDSALTAENIVIREGGVGFGSGANNGTDSSTLGALRAFAGTSSVNNVELIGGNNLIGAAAGATVVVNGQVMSGINNTNRLIKVGPGTLQLAGTLDNVYRGETRVLGGTLELNKTAGKNAIGGDLIIGDNIGGDNAATVKLLQSNQIPQLNFFEVALNTLTLNSSGLLDFNGKDDVVGNLVLTTGTTYSSDIATGAGTLTLGGNVTVNGFQGSSGATPAATISGKLELGSFFSGAGGGTSRVFTINDTQEANLAADLTISAVISGTSDVSITRAGTGTMRLSGASTFAGPFIMNGGGIVEIGSNSVVAGGVLTSGPLGIGLVSLQNNSNTLRPVGASRTVANPIGLDGDVAFLSDDATPGVENLTLSGAVTLSATRALRVMDSAMTVAISGVVGEGVFGSQGIDKRGHGTLALEAANTYSGATTVNEDGGTLLLRSAGSILNSSSVTVNINATLKIDNSAAVVSDRVNDAVTVNTSGTLWFTGNATSDAAEQLGPLTFNGQVAHNVIVENNSNGAFTSSLSVSTINVDSDRTINFQGLGLDLSATGKNRFSSINSPLTGNANSLDDGILKGSRITGPSGVDLATFDSSPEGFAIIPLPASAYVTDLSLASATSNVKLAAGTYDLTTSKSINALLLAPGAKVQGGAGATLVINSGLVVFAGVGTSEIAVANVSLGVGNSVSIHTASEGTIGKISGNWYQAGGNVAKGGAGNLILSGDNQFTNNLTIDEGVVTFQSSTAAGAPSQGTFIRQGATLQLQDAGAGPVNVGLEALEVRSNAGFIPAAANGDYAQGLGAVRNLAGNNTWAGNFSRRGDNSAVANIQGLLGGVPDIFSPMVFVDVVGISQLTLTGTFADGNSNPEVIKRGAGTFQVAGTFAASINQNVRVLEGTLALNAVPGQNPINGGSIFVGSDLATAPKATVKLLNSDQIEDGRPIVVYPSGTLDMNGFSDRFAAVTLVVGPAGAGSVNIGTGAMLTLNGDINVFTIGTGNAASSSITGGTLALQAFGAIGGGTNRNFQVNDGATGTDLTITSAIVDGTGLQSMGVNKNGFGTLEYAGATPNTYTNSTVVNEGALLLNKGTGGAGGVSAFMGNLTIGNNDVTSGFAGSDLVRLLQPNQIPDLLVNVTLASTGKLDLNGKDETIGLADAQNVLTMQASSIVDLNGATLTLIGNINTSPATGAGLWTPVVATRIIDSVGTGLLDFGNVTRTIDEGGDRSELPWEIQISAKLKGTGGLNHTNSGTWLLDGDNSALSGDLLRTNGSFAVGSDKAFGATRVLMNGGSIATYNGPRTIANEFEFINTVGFLGGNNLAGTGAVGGGGNDLKISGLVNVVASTWQPSVPFAGQVEFAGGIGETMGSVTARKIGYGVMIVSSVSTLSGLEIGQDGGGGPGNVRVNGGSLILRDNGTWLNASPLIGYGGTLEIDNSGLNNTNRLNDLSNIDMAGGTFAYIGKSGATASEILGPLRLRNSAAASAVQMIQPAGANTINTLRFASLTQETTNNGNTIRFLGRGANLSSAGTNRVGFITAPTLTNGIVPFGVVDGSGGLDFATVINPSPATTPADNFVAPLTTFATAFAGATATTNVKLSAAEAVDTALTVNAVLLPTGLRNITGAGALTIGSGLLISSGNNTVSVPTLTLGGAEGILFADSGTLTVSSAIGGATSDLAKAGRGVAVISGANTFAGTTRITSGVFRATNSLAFGTTANGTTVTYGSTAEFSNNINVAAENIDVSGTGDANFGSVGLRNIDGNNLWNGNLTLQISAINRNALEIAAGSSLNVAGVVSGQGLSKTGAGTLQFSGTAANTFGGGGLLIWQGTVELNKTGVNAVATGTTVGDNVGAAISEKLVLLQSNQIADGNTVTVSSVGKLDLGDFADTIASFSLQTGLIASGAISTNAAGLLTINGNSTIDTIANSGGGGSAGSATIAGNLALQVAGGAAATRTITVNDSVSVEDVNVTAVITDGDGNANLQGLTKAGGGRMVLKAANTYSGLTTVSGGELVAADPLALGAAGTVASGAGTIVNSSNNNLGANASLLLQGVSVTGEGLRLDSINNNANNGTGFNAEGALRSLSGTNVWTGDVTINTDNSNNFSNVTIKVDAGQLTISGAIGQQNQSTVGLGMFKIGEGILEYAGATANTYTGPTTVGQGVLQLNKTAGVNALAATLTIGNINGAQGTDIVRWIQSNQIATGQTILVESGGVLDLNGNNETFDGFGSATNAINLRHNTTQSSQVLTRAAGKLFLATNANIASTLNGGSVQTYLSPPSMIVGNLDLSGVTHGIDVADVALLHGEMLMNVAITSPLTTNAFTKTNTGVLALSGDNSTGLAGVTTTLSAGGLALLHNNALGTSTSTLNVTGGTQLFGNGTPNVGAPTPPVVFANNITLNSDLTLRGDRPFTIGGTITNAAGNRNLNANLQAAASVTLSGTVNLSNDATNRTLTINNNTFGGGVNSVITGGNVTISGQIVNGGGSAASALTKGGNGLVTLSNDTNSYAGVTTVAAGLLQVAANGALGTNGAINTNQTTVNNGATLLVAAGLTLPEWLVLNNNGFGNFGSVRLLDSTPNTTETATISGNVNFNATAFVGVDAGGAAPDRLIFSGALNSGGGLTTKVGLGEVEFAGTTDNGVTFTGGPSPFDDGIEVRAGTLYFNKTGANRVITGGTINVGDGGGGNDSDRLILIGSGTDQIADNLTVSIGGSGKLTMAGAATETIANLTLLTGESNSADVDTTATRTLTVTSNVTVNTFNVTDGNAPAALIAGNIIVNGTVTVNDTFVPSASDDLAVTANFNTSGSAAAAGGFYAGLREGRILNNAFDITTANPGSVLQLQPRLAQTTAQPPWGGNETWVYTGQFFDADGIFTFAENIDDSVLIKIDGVVRLRNETWDVATSTAVADGLRTQNGTEAQVVTGANVAGALTNFGMGPLGDGWHDIEIRVGNGGGGSGPSGQIAGGVDTGWTTTFGLGLNTSATNPADANGLNFTAPIDPGNATLFRTSVAGITATTPNVGSSTLTKAGAGTLALKSATGHGVVNVNGGALSLSGNGALPNAFTLNVAAGANLVLDNSTTAINDRIGDVALVGLTGATISLIGNATTPVSETIGAVTINAANTLTNTIQSTTSGTGTNTLTAASLARNAGATLNLVGVGSEIGSASNQVNVTGGTNPFANGIIPYATVSSGANIDLVTDGDGNSAAAPYSISKVTTYANDINVANGIVKLTGAEPLANLTLAANTTVAGLLLTGNAVVSALPGVTLTVGSATAGLVVSTGGSSVISAPLAFGGREELFLVQAGSLEVSGGITGTATLRKERPGTLILSGDNIGMTGAIQVQQGTITARHNNSFGTTAGGVNVLAGGSLVLDADLTIGNEQLDLSGSTGVAFGSIVDTLRVSAGKTVTWGTGTTAINSNAASFIDVLAGATLNFNATVGGGATVTKYGPGALVYQGTAQNGNTQTVNVNEGTLRLAKTSGTGPIAIRGTLNINDLGNFDPIGAATVIYDATAAADQIGDVAVNVNANGTLDTNGITDTIANTLTVNGGIVKNTAGGGTLQVNALTMTGGLVDTGTGTLNLNGTLTYTSGLATNGPATVNGNLNLLAANPRTITVNDGYFSNNDLTINAVISNGRISKNGNGALLLTATNNLLPDIDQSQVLTIPAGVTAFTLSFNNFNQNLTTASIPYTAATPPENIQAALELLNNIQAGNVAVTGVAGGPYTITFKNALAGIGVTALTATGTGGTPTFVNTAGATGFNLNAGTLTLGSDTVLGTNRLVMTGNVNLLPSGARKITNPITLFNNLTYVLGGRRDFTGNDSLELAGSVSVTPDNRTINLQVDDPLTPVTISGVVGGGNGSFTLTKTGIGTLSMSAANTFLAPFNVSAGIVRASNNDTFGARTNEIQLLQDTGAAYTITFNGATTASIPTGSNAATVAAALNALSSVGGSNGSVTVTGTGVINATTFDPFRITFQGFLSGTDVGQITATGATVLGTQFNGGGTTVSSGAEIQLVSGLTIGNELLNVNGQGFLNRTSVPSLFVGAIHALSGDSSWGTGMTSIVLSGTSYFGTDGTSTLLLNGATSGGQALFKVGSGALTLGGVLPNTHSGTTAIFNGTIIADKPAGLNASTGGWNVGDNVGAGNSDMLILNKAEQLNDGQTVTVAGTGQLVTNAAQGASLTNEVQQVQVGNAGPGGQFRLQFAGATTGDLAFGATAAQIQAALNALTTIGGAGGSVIVTGSAGQNANFTVVFLGSLAGVNQPALKIVTGTTAFTGATLAVTTIAQGGLAGRETIGVPSGNNPQTSLTLRMAPQATGNISLNAGSTLALQGDVVVDTYGALIASSTGAAILGGTIDLRQQSAAGNAATRTFTVADGPAADDLTITSKLAEGASASVANLNKAGVGNSRLVLGSTAASTFTGSVTVSNGNLTITSGGALGSTFTDEVQSYIINNVLGNASGTYVINTDLGPTAAIPFNASADEVQAALSAVYGAGKIQVVSAISGNTNVQYFIRWLVPGGVAPLFTFTPTSTSTTNAPVSYLTDVLLDAFNGAGAGLTNYETLLTGSVTVGAADPLTWSFGTSSDDGSAFWVDVNQDGVFSASERIVNNGGSHGIFNVAGTATFPAAGTYKIAIGFFQGTGGAGLEARFAKGIAAYGNQTIISPAAQPGMWADDANVADQLTLKVYNRTPVVTDLDPSVSPITIASSLTNASVGTIATNQDGGQFAGTTVQGNTALELRSATGITILNETLTLNGSGIVNAPAAPVFNNGTQSSAGTGALRSVSGDNVWNATISGAGNVNVNANPSGISVAAGTKLTIGATNGFSSLIGNQPWVKQGPGTLELGGLVSNTNSSNTYINEGTLLLNKQGTGTTAIQAGEVMLGDNLGADNSDVIQYGPAAGSDQILNQTIRIARTGLLDLNGINETNNAAITLDVGPTVSADVSTGVGVLSNNNQFTVVSQAGQTAASPAATFKGIYDLSGATRNIEVRDGIATTEFDIQGTIQVTGAFGITKIGQGRLRLSGNNTYTGTTTVSAGVLEVGSANALGTTAGATTVANNTAISFNSATPITLAEPITIVGDGWNNDGLGSLNNIGAGNVTLTAPLTITSNSYKVTNTIANFAAGSTLSFDTWSARPGDLIFNGAGDIVMLNSIPSFSALQGRLFMATALGITNTTGGAGGGINDLIPGGSRVPNATATLTSGMNFPVDSDAAFTTFFGAGQPAGASFTAVFFGTMTIPVTGTYYIDVSNNDDTAALWIGSGATFAATDLIQQVPCCGQTAVVATTLNAGTYKVAFVVEDTGGNSGLVGRASGLGGPAPTNSTTLPIVNNPLAGNVIKNGTGTLTLLGGHNYQQTVINAGTVLVNGSVANNAAAPDVVVNGGSTLGGNGTVFGDVQVNATGNVAPGPTPELLNTGSITWTPTSTYTVNIAGAAPGTGYDQLKVTGTVTLGNATLVAAQSFAPTPGQVLTIIANDGADAVIGTFNNLPEGAPITIGGTIYHVTYKYNFDTSTLGTGNDVALIRNNDLTAVADTFSAVEDTPFTGNVKTNDTDLDNDGAFQVVANPTKGTLSAINAATGAFTYTPSANFSGTDSFTYKLFDGEFTSSTVTVTINVAAVADTPTISVTNASGNEDTAIPLTFSGTLTDTDGSETLSYRISSVPAGATFSAGTNAGGGVWNFTAAQLTGLTFTPPQNVSGAIPLAVSAVATETSNGSTIASAPATLTVTITAVADTPSIATTPAVGTEDLSIALVFSGVLADADGSEVLSYSISNVPTGATLTAGTNAGGGVWNLTAAQAVGVAIIPPSNSDADFTLTVTAIATETSNNSAAQASATLAVTVNAAADAPTLSVSPAFGVEDGAPIPLAINGALTDTDGSETLSFRIDNVPAAGSLSAGLNQGGGTWLLTAAQITGLNFIQPPNAGGIYPLQVSAIATETSNNSSVFTSATLTVTVDAVADTPSITTSPATGNEDTPIPLTFNGVLADTDGSEVLSYRFSNVPAGATLSAGTNQGGGVWTVTLPQSFGLAITPPANSSAPFTLTVTAIATEQSNGSNAQASANLAVTVNAVADQPNLTVTPATGPEDTNIPLSITSSLVDTDGSESLSIAISGVPAGASLSAGTNNGGGNWTLTPAQLAGLNFIPIPNTSAAYTLTVTATSAESSNASTAQRTAPLLVTVSGVADTPTLTIQPAAGLEDTFINLTISGALTDTDGSETLSFRIANVPTGATFNAGTNQGGGVWTFTAAEAATLAIKPPLNSDAEMALSVQAVSTEGLTTAMSAAQTLNVTVTAVADAVTLTVPGPLTGILENTAVALPIAASLFDTDGSETLTVAITNVPSDAQIIGGTNMGGGVWNVPLANLGSLQFKRANNPIGSAPFTITVTATTTETDPAATPRTQVTTKNISLQVVDQKPTAQYLDALILGTSYGPVSTLTLIPGVGITFTVAATDLAGALDNPFTFEINWGDGPVVPATVTNYVPGQPLQLSHVYGTYGTFTPTLRVKDRDGLYSDTIPLATIVAKRIVVQDGTLYVAGSNLGDRIIVQQALGGVSVRINNEQQPLQQVSDRVIIFGNDGADTIQVSGNLLVPVEFYGGNGDDYLSGGGFGDLLDGGPGNDRLLGGNGDDTLLGGAGNDTAGGGNGNDYIAGDLMVDIIGGTLLPDGSTSQPGDIIDSGFAGKDNLSGDGGNDTIVGGAGADTLNGGVGHDFIRGGAGGDRLDGGDGNDFLFGENDSDVLYGRAGRDVLIGGLGTDQTYGGTSSDLIFGGEIDPLLADDFTLAAIWQAWSAGASDDAMDQLMSVASDDISRDSLNGEGDEDWYLMFILHKDTFATAAESKAPNRTFLM